MDRLGPIAGRVVRRTVGGALGLGVLAGAATPAAAQRVARSGGVREARAAAGTPLDPAAIRDTALASLVRAEGRFMADVAARGADGWADAFAEGGAMFPAGRDVAVGPAAARTLMTRVFADTSVHVVWHPVYAAVSGSGDLGYTYGYYRWASRDSTGAPAAPDDGKFVTVWRRGGGGAWKVAVDLGNGGPVPAGFFDRAPRP